MTTEEVLIEARALLAEPYRWSKGKMKRNRYLPGSNKTLAIQCFCALGAVKHVSAAHAKTDHPTRVLLDTLAQESGGFTYGVFSGLTLYNDQPTTKKKDILALFDTAIERARA